MPRPADPYAAISALYDQGPHVEVPAAFFRVVAPLVRRSRGGPAVLDLGCGSGLLSERIAAAGVDVLGVDASAPMLALARKRCARHGPHARFVTRRFLSLRLPPVHRLALACHDVLNHIHRPVLLAHTLAAFRAGLAPGGLLIFDTVTERCFRELWTDNTHGLASPRGELWMECDYDSRRRRARARMVGYLRGTDGRFSRHEATIHETAWSDAQLKAALRVAGFLEIWRQPWSPWGERSAPEKTLWCARAPGDDSDAAPLLRRLGFRRQRQAT